jgi:hypothetical protein
MSPLVSAEELESLSPVSLIGLKHEADYGKLSMNTLGCGLFAATLYGISVFL